MTCSQTPAPALVTPWVMPSAGCHLTLRHKTEVSAQLCPDTTQHVGVRESGHPGHCARVVILTQNGTPICAKLYAWVLGIPR